MAAAAPAQTGEVSRLCPAGCPQLRADCCGMGAAPQQAGASEEFQRFQDAAPRAASAEQARTLAALSRWPSLPCSVHACPPAQ